jgi:hypothetical protein
MSTATATPPQQRTMQGIAVPSTSVNPPAFFEKTRRKRQIEKAQTAWAGLGGTDIIEFRKSDILAGVLLRIRANFTTVNGTGAVTATGRWPYDILNRVKFTANGQSNLINASGLKLKAHEYMDNVDLCDRSVSQTYGGATVTNGTLSLSHESWGVGSNGVVAPGTYDLDFTLFIPIAQDQKDLVGAIFAASSSTDLTMSLEWNTLASLFTLTGTAACVFNSGSYTCEAIRYSIPKGDNGEIIVPELSVFHTIVQTDYTALQVGDNEVRLIGQGAGKRLLRTWYQTWNGAVSAAAPLVMNDTNYGRQAWRYSGNETPDELLNGTILRALNEREYNTDIGKVWGFGCHDFAVQNAFRDTVDLGQTSDFRILSNILTALTGSPRLEYVSETVYVAGA